MDSMRRALGPVALLALVLLFVLYNLKGSDVRTARTGVFQTSRGRTEDLLVIVPHPDDELLGPAALLAQTRGRKTVVTVTEGDGFRVAVSLHSGRAHPRPGDYERFAGRRTAEQATALSRMFGSHSVRVIRLGFPDRGLEAMMDRRGIYTSPYTRDRRTEPESFEPGTPHEAASLYRALKEVIRTERPTLVVAPHPSDSHPDHHALAGLVDLAVTDLKREGGLPRRARLYRFLVHRGGWPKPRGEHPALPLLPPTTFRRTDSQWYRLPIPSGTRRQLRAAISAHRTQMALLRPVLLAFVRQNALLATVPDYPLPPGGRLVLAEPARDTLLRKTDPSRDLLSVVLSRSADGRILSFRAVTTRSGQGAIRYVYRVWLPRKGGLARLVKQTGSARAAFRSLPRGPALVGVSLLRKGGLVDESALRVVLLT